VHLLLYPKVGTKKISHALADIKRPVARRAIAYLVGRKSPYLRHLTVCNKSRTYHRFWQAGPGQDHNIYDSHTAHRVVEYIHFNPVRRGLVTRAEDWYWSSAPDWFGATDVPMKVDRTLPPIVEFSRC
jgi:putative transposase